MKHVKKIVSLVLALVMALSLNVTTFAAENTAALADTDMVTVYFTKNTFTEGGLTGYQEYTGGNSPAATSYNTDLVADCAITLSVSEINQYMNRSVYKSDYTGNLNVLDAIIAALRKQNSSIAISGGWDSYTTPNGGYINSAGTVVPTYGETRTATVDGVSYTVYTGYGYNIACTQDGVLRELDYYGTEYDLTAGMKIVFDYGYYEIYWAN